MHQPRPHFECVRIGAWVEPIMIITELNFRIMGVGWEHPYFHEMQQDLLYQLFPTIANSA